MSVMTQFYQMDALAELHLPTWNSDTVGMFQSVVMVDKSGEWQNGFIGGIWRVSGDVEIILSEGDVANVRIADIVWSRHMMCWIVREV